MMRTRRRRRCYSPSRCCPAAAPPLPRRYPAATPPLPVALAMPMVHTPFRRISTASPPLGLYLHRSDYISTAGIASPPLG